MRKMLTVFTITLFSISSVKAETISVKLSPTVTGKLTEEKQETTTVKYYRLQFTEGGRSFDIPVIAVKDGNTYYYYLADKKYVVENGELKLIATDVKIKEKPVELSQEQAQIIKQVVADYLKKGFNLRINNNEEKPTLYVVWDVFCPFCKEGIKNGTLNKLKEKYSVIVVPFAVHGKASLKGEAYFLERSKEIGVEESLKEWFSKIEPRVIEKVQDKKKFEEELNKLSSNERLEDFILNKSKKLFQAGITATPTFVVEKEEKMIRYVGNPSPLLK